MGKHHNGIPVIDKVIRHAEEFKLRKISLNPEKQDFPVDAFPGVVKDLIQEYHEKYGYPVEYLGAGALSTFSAAMGNHYRLQVKGQWVEAPILWNCIVGDSGTAKTPSLRSIMSPLHDYQKKQFKTYENAVEEWETQAQASKLAGKIYSEPKPKLNQIIIQDATLEALCAAHKYNKRGLLQTSDELIGWINSMNQYRKGNDAQRWLEIYNNGNIIINRVTRDDVLIENACVNVIGGIQHKIIKELVKENRDKDGFLYRILFFIPNEYEPAKFMTDDVSETTLEEYRQSVDFIIKGTHEFNLIFSDDARKRYAQWFDKNTDQMVFSEDTTRREIYSKLSGQLARLIITIHGMKYAQGFDMDAEKIDIDSVKRGIALIEYFRYTACKVSNTLNVMANPKIKHAAKLLAAGNTVRTVADKLDISPGTVSKWKQKHADIFEKALNQ